MIRVRRYRHILVSLLIVVSAGSAQQDGPGSNAGAPKWIQEHMEFMTRSNGRWITDNTPFRSEAEPFDAYGTEWKWGIGKKSMIGRLFGMRDGEEVGDFWEFHVFWHPGESQVYIHQYAGQGTVGIGTMDSTGTGMLRMEQRFYGTDGTVLVMGHETWEEDGAHHTQSYDITGEGVWEKRRYYVWKLEE